MMSDETVKSQKSGFIKGIVTGIAVMAILGGVFILGKSYGGGSGSGLTDTTTGGSPTVPTDTTGQQPPAADGSRIAAVTSADHIRGDKNAPITLIEYSDFECPFCARFRPTVDQILTEYKGRVRLVYRHFPLRSIHSEAQKAAEASECAADQGKFWEMHDKLFDLNEAGSLALANMKLAAAELGFNTTSFNDCLDSGKYAQEVEKDYQDGLAGGVSGTPGSFLNGQYIAGALPFAQIQPIIESLL